MPTKTETVVACLVLVAAAILAIAHWERRNAERAILAGASPPPSGVAVSTEADRQRIRAHRARVRAFSLARRYMLRDAPARRTIDGVDVIRESDFRGRHREAGGAQGPEARAHSTESDHCEFFQGQVVD